MKMTQLRISLGLKFELGIGIFGFLAVFVQGGKVRISREPRVKSSSKKTELKSSKEFHAVTVWSDKKRKGEAEGDPRKCPVAETPGEGFPGKAVIQHQAQN